MVKHRGALQHRKHLAQIEDDTLRLADRIILNNRSQMRWMLGENKALLKKAHLIRHTFEETLYPEGEPKPRKKLRFVFIGHLDEIRSALPLFEGIRALKDELASMGAYTIGRYGGWTYCSMEDCMLEAEGLAETLTQSPHTV